MQDQVLDIVVRWTDDVAGDNSPHPGGKVFYSAPGKLQLWFYVRDQEMRKHFFSVNLNGGPDPIMTAEGLPENGEISWGLVQIGATVWKVRPSVVCSDLHAYLTVMNVPYPAPWLAG